MNWTLDKQLFTGLALLLFLFNLTLIIDYAWVWMGTESYIANALSTGSYKDPITWIIAQFTEQDFTQLAIFRLPSVFACVFGGLAGILICRKLFSQDLLILIFLTLINSYGLLFMAKVASTDSWNFCFQVIAILAMIKFIKQAKLIWRIIHYLALFFAIWVNPISNTLLFLLLPSVYYLFLSQGKRLLSLNTWLAVLLSLAILYFTNQLLWYLPNAYLGWGQSTALKFTYFWLLGYLPLLGFLFAGLYGGIKRLRKKEEFSILFISWILIAYLTQSSSILFVSAILIGKHVQDYLLPQYPYGGIIKAYSVIHLILFFFLASFLMLGGFFLFRGAGFRTGLSFSFVYWVLSFVLVIGLYGKNRRFIFAGSFMTGLLSSILFSILIFPLIENQRISSQISNYIEDNKLPTNWIKYESDYEESRDNLKLKLDQFLPDQSARSSTLTPGDAFGITLEKTNTADTTAINGWRDNGKIESWKIVRSKK